MSRKVPAVILRISIDWSWNLCTIREETKVTNEDKPTDTSFIVSPRQAKRIQYALLEPVVGAFVQVNCVNGRQYGEDYRHSRR